MNFNFFLKGQFKFETRGCFHFYASLDHRQELRFLLVEFSYLATHIVRVGDLIYLLERTEPKPRSIQADIIQTNEDDIGHNINGPDDVP